MWFGQIYSIKKVYILSTEGALLSSGNGGTAANKNDK